MDEDQRAIFRAIDANAPPETKGFWWNSEDISRILSLPAGFSAKLDSAEKKKTGFEMQVWIWCLCNFPEPMGALDFFSCVYTDNNLSME
jgi:hypothetical protein